MPTYKDTERGTWYAKFNHKDWMGKTKQVLKRGFKTQKEAKAWERDFLNKSTAGPDMTFRSLVKIYMEDASARLKPTTFSGKRFLIDRHVLPYFSDMKLNTIEASTVRRWQNELITHDNSYTQTYLKTINNQLSAIFNFAMRYYKLPSNPARTCGSMGKKHADTMLFWTVDEFSKFISIVSNKPMSKVIFELLFWTGIRSGEMLALTLADFNFDAQTINIDKNFAMLEGEELTLDTKTNKSKRIITIPQFICDLVQDYAAQLYDYKPNERLFRATKHYLYHEMIRGCKISGAKKIRVHDLRHSHASLLIEMGFSPILIAERLGHENIETTLQTYSHLYPNKQSEVSAKLQTLRTETEKQTVETTET